MLSMNDRIIDIENKNNLKTYVEWIISSQNRVCVFFEGVVMETH